jgi:hypothetical protein
MIPNSLAAGSRCTAVLKRFDCGRAFALRCALSLLLALAALPAFAIGPEAPVDFVDVYLPKGYLLMVMQPEQLTEVEAMRTVYRDGEPLSRAPIEWRSLKMLDYNAPITKPDSFRYRVPGEAERSAAETSRLYVRVPEIESAQARPSLVLARPGAALVLRDERPKRVGALIPLQPESHRALKDGAYAERYTVRARIAGNSDKGKPLTMVRWVHFVVRDGQVRYIDQAEYSRMVDPPTDALDGAGGKIQVNTGRGIKADVPLERTRHHRAVPLGRLGGVAPEREAAPRERTRSETNEK